VTTAETPHHSFLNNKSRPEFANAPTMDPGQRVMMTRLAISGYRSLRDIKIAVAGRRGRIAFDIVGRSGSIFTRNEHMDAAIADAFPGARSAMSSTDGYLELEMRQHGLLRPLKCSELSDGTLRYLLLVAALLSPRPPALMVLNEPETSLHPELLPPLARLIAQASKQSQVVVVSHASALVSALQAEAARRNPRQGPHAACVDLAFAIAGRLPPMLSVQAPA
jgi:hypothetical protein